MLDLKGIAADQVAGQLLDVDLDGPIAVALGVGLAPAVDAGVGLDLAKEPVFAGAGVDQKCLDVCDFHIVPYLLEEWKARRREG